VRVYIPKKRYIKLQVFVHWIYKIKYNLAHSNVFKHWIYFNLSCKILMLQNIWKLNVLLIQVNIGFFIFLKIEHNILIRDPSFHFWHYDTIATELITKIPAVLIQQHLNKHPGIPILVVVGCMYFFTFIYLSIHFQIIVTK
jgi:hypothetical protein